jgi:hypothetical protein
LLAHLQTAWARKLVEEGISEKAARAATEGHRGYPFQMQEDLLARGEWDETGQRYARSKAKLVRKATTKR